MKTNSNYKENKWAILDNNNFVQNIVLCEDPNHALNKGWIKIKDGVICHVEGYATVKNNEIIACTFPDVEKLHPDYFNSLSSEHQRLLRDHLKKKS